MAYSLFFCQIIFSIISGETLIISINIYVKLKFVFFVYVIYILTFFFYNKNYFIVLDKIFF